MEDVIHILCFFAVLVVVVIFVDLFDREGIIIFMKANLILLLFRLNF